MLKPPRNWRFFIFQKAVLKDIVDFFNMLIGVEGGEDSCGSTGQAQVRRGGSPARPRTACRLERKSTFKINTAFQKERGPSYRNLGLNTFNIICFCG